MTDYRIADYIVQNNVGFAIVHGSDLRTATVEDITTNRGALHNNINYELNTLIKRCKDFEMSALLVISTVESRKLADEEYSAAYVAAKITAKAGNAGMPVIHIIKNTNKVEQYTMAPNGHSCKHLNEKECSLESFLNSCHAEA